MSSIEPPVRDRTSALLGELGGTMAERIATGEAIRRQHANALTWVPAELPDAVVWPQSTAEVCQIVRLAARHRVPIIAFGAGTSLEGHINAPDGGISMDLSRMNRILEVNTADLDCTLEAGVRRGELNRHLRDTGLFFSVDPGAEDATLGGMAATRASGTTSVRYGTMRENVVRLTAVMADGSVVRTGGKVRKSAAGYDLTRLLVGSEGTLGIITELTLRLHPVPEATGTALATFPTVEAACQATIEAVQHGLALTRIELLDALQIKAVNAYSQLALAELPTLIMDIHGSPAGVASDIESLIRIARTCGAQHCDFSLEAGQRSKLWRARHDAFWAIKSFWPGREILVTDVCVPISRLADCVAATAADIQAAGLLAPIVGHVGDGNFHVIVVLDPADAREATAVRSFVERLSLRALDMDGTCSGEHGIGQGKMAALARELGDGMEVIRRIKQALDPQGILNPGKIVGPADAPRRA